MTELEAKLYWIFLEKIKTVAPLQGIQMTEQQACKLAIDLCQTAAHVLVNENSQNYEGQAQCTSTK